MTLIKAMVIKTDNKKIPSVKSRRGAKRVVHRKWQSTDSEQRRLCIMKAALEVFGEKGFHAAKIDDITSRARIAHGTFYLYFPSKSALATELIGAQGATFFLESILEDYTPKEPDPAGLLKNIVKKYFGNLEDRLPLMRFRIVEAISHPNMGREYYRTLLHRLILDLGHLIQKYQQKGVLKEGDSFIYGHIFYGMLFTFLYCQELLHGKEITKVDLEKIIPQIVDVFLNGTTTQAVKTIRSHAITK